MLKIAKKAIVRRLLFLSKVSFPFPKLFKMWILALKKWKNYNFKQFRKSQMYHNSKFSYSDVAKSATILQRIIQILNIWLTCCQKFRLRNQQMKIFTYQLHGSIQIRLIHASSREHSSSRTHPGGFSIGIGTQERSVSGTHPVRHEQIMVRNGTVSTTEQTAVASQGFNSKQGLRHLASMQAKPDAQSASTTHSGSAITDSGGGLGVQSTKGSPTYPGRERWKI